MHFSQPAKDDLAQYKKKVKFLKGVVEAEKLKSPTEKLMAMQLLSPTSAKGTTYHPSDKTREIFLQTQTKHSEAIRGELFAKKNTLRKRNANDKADSNDVDVVLKYHHEMQEKVAEEMVSLAHNLKENCTLANEIIRKDVEVINKRAF